MSTPKFQEWRSWLTSPKCAEPHFDMVAGIGRRFT